ncbi:MAG TPA: ribonuclease HII [Clostridiales bacterium]|nr:ribonuclease HII [Clostridiales bacterium]
MIDKLQYEKQLIKDGYARICGVDEVGRGPLAGPVVCAAVIMPLDDIIESVDDSKKLSAKKREKLSEIILKKAIAYSICLIEPQIIDEINILQATRLCMKNAVESLEVKPDFVLTDGNMTLDIQIPQKSIVKGDSLSYTIGCASIVAKVYRDKLMCEYDKIYPEYCFAKNKGYGTEIHIRALERAGLCPVHRRSFTKRWQ